MAGLNARPRPLSPRRAPGCWKRFISVEYPVILLEALDFCATNENVPGGDDDPFDGIDDPARLFVAIPYTPDRNGLHGRSVAPKKRENIGRLYIDDTR